MRNRLRQLRHFAILAAIVAAGFWSVTLATAQGTEDQTTTYQDWTVNCSNSQSTQICGMFQRLRLGDGEAQISLEISMTQDNSVSGIIIAPFGLDISKGVSLNIDGGPRFSLPFRTCRQFGCVAPFNFGTDFVELLQRGSTLRTTLYGLDGTSGIDVPFSLNGFSAALADFEQR